MCLFFRSSRVFCILASISERGPSVPESSFSSVRIAGLESVNTASSWVSASVCFPRARAIPSSSPSKWVAFVPRYPLPDISGCLSLSVLLGLGRVLLVSVPQSRTVVGRSLGLP